MARRQTAMAASEAELQRLQGVGNKSDAKTPELGPRRVPSQAGQKRPAQPSCPIEVVSPADRPAAPRALRDRVDAAQVQREAARDGGSLVGAGGNAAPRSEAAILAAWKGQDKGEHRLRLVHQLFLVTPWCLKTPQRLAALVLLVLVGALMAGRSARPGRRAWAELQPPLKGWRPAGRDSWRPTVPRRCKAFAASRLVPVQEPCGRGVESRFARLKPVQGHSLELLGLPQPAELWAQPGRVCGGAGEAWVGPRAGTVQGPGGGRTAHGRGGRGGAATAMAGAHAALQRAPIV
jgi:hypothetical protein